MHARAAGPATRPLGRATLVVLGAWFLVQVVVPLRFLAYRGNVNWDEEGFRFAWRVMVMEKAGDARFRVSDAATGTTAEVDPRDYLTPLQARMMASQPDMILDFAHFVAERFATPEGRLPAVRADVYASLNGRPNRRLVDPTVDLARAPASAARTWVLPLE